MNLYRKNSNKLYRKTLNDISYDSQTYKSKRVIEFLDLFNFNIND